MASLRASDEVEIDMQRVDTLLAKLELHRHELDAMNFGDEISDFTVVELLALSANLDRAIGCTQLSLT